MHRVALLWIVCGEDASTLVVSCHVPTARRPANAVVARADWGQYSRNLVIEPDRLTGDDDGR